METKKWKTIAGVSILLNLLLGGIIIGHGFHLMMLHQHIHITEKEVISQLSPKGAEEFRNAIHKLHDKARQTVDLLHNSYHEFATILMESPFDKEKFKRSFESLLKLHDERAREIVAILQQLGENLDSKDRKIITKHLKNLIKTH